ncbi:54S ribosomal protein L19, mitochondrial [Komagataella phaffii CBS 7435]|uniref:Large ribosomal subunit protein uL11m n=2 Tax=Komagataella phaffii TaxID=460519 RepID=C4QV94_KOMPG|nr:mitochondrial 54S ribosomal protein YmL19 [Komagataella phaffii GS115]AOA61833.1 GQ67_02363T0 [Komagataella phaffii]CAH2445821.1 54S ribosomal protein L19, mitochondrial [Komagataella phaffii CBS 7435]AOA66630.1 GQ68_02884T0 [Komagataella phaffii GS115]CAY67167.1 Mitochondrial ribosomal protein of the large subunit [Komagataella phaffii GS115]CCA36276.1 54S ribosomal protein L19, mitochondrial [Komagataella phaffii CBS 7435]
MSAKNHLIKLIVGAGQAAPAPPVGPALGSKGVKAIDFCKEFNARTASYQPGVPIPAIITVKPDRSFSFELKSPPTGYLLLRAAGIPKGAPKVGPGQPKVGTVSLKHVYEIATIKKTDQRHEKAELKGIVKSIIATAKSMGIDVVK